MGLTPRPQVRELKQRPWPETSERRAKEVAAPLLTLAAPLLWLAAPWPTEAPTPRTPGDRKARISGRSPGDRKALPRRRMGCCSEA